MISAFESMRLRPDLIQLLRHNGIAEPTPIQQQAIPHVLEGKDVIAQSQTGTGKTLAYLLPVLHNMDASVKELQAVILVPTRELGMQILREAEMLNEKSGIRAQALIGGAAISRQVEKLRQHPHVVVGTPGRILELIKMRKLKMHHVKTIVVDEVDQVFQLGSIDEVEQVLRSAMRDRQIVFFSATIPSAIQETADRWMNEPVTIRIEPAQKTSQTLEHLYFTCEEREKIDTLRRLVRLYNPRSAIVFVNETDSIGELIAKLRYVGLSVEPLYGESGKQERAVTLQRFRDGKFQLLLATDVAARGLDIKGLPMVINYDLPIDADHYVHRAGRTGRMGKRGTVLSILSNKEQFIIHKFEKALDITIAHKTMYEGKVVDPGEISPSPAAARMRREPHRSGSNGTNKANERGVRIKSAGPVPYVHTNGNGKTSSFSSNGNGSAAGALRKERERNRKNKGAPKWLKGKDRQK